MMRKFVFVWMGRLVPLPTPINLPLLVLMTWFGIVLLVVPVPAGASGYVLGALLEFVLILRLIHDGRLKRAWLCWYGALLILPLLGVAVLSFLVADWPAKVAIFAPLAQKFGMWIAYWSPMPRAWSGLVHPNTLGMLSAPMIPLQIGALSGLWSFPRRKEMEASGIVSLGVLGAIALLPTLFIFGISQSRAAYVAVAAAFAGMMLWAMPKIWRWGLAGSGLFVGIWHWQDVRYSLETVLGTASTLNTRVDIWTYTLLVIQGFPVTGVGFRSLRYRLPLLFPKTYFRLFSNNLHFNAHNAYLQTAADLGLPGLAAFLAVLGMTVWMWGHVWQARSRIAAIWHIPPAMVLGLWGAFLAEIVFGLFEANGVGVFAIGWTIIGLLTGLFVRFGISKGETR